MVSSLEINKFLKNVYTNPESPGSYGSVKKLYEEAKKVAKTKELRSSITLKSVRSFLQGESAYTLHKPPVGKKEYRKTITSKSGVQYQADLLEMTDVAKVNNGIKYLITCIDIFSRKAWVVGVKDKQSATVAKGFEVILKEAPPTKLQTDRGKEFLGDPFQKLLKKYHVHHFHSTNPDIKCALVERFNRTLRSRIGRFYTANKTFRYIGKLQQFVNAYNNSFHRSINTTPNLAAAGDQRKLYRHLYMKDSFTQRSFKLKVGDYVLLLKKKSTFDKESWHRWNNERFIVTRRAMQQGVPVYWLRDLDGEEIHGFFYETEIQTVSEK